MSQSVILRRHPTSERAALAGFARISGQVLEIQRFIRSKPEATHREIVLSLCRLWNWRYMTGELRLAACRHLLHALHDRGHIELPPMDLRERSSWRMRLELEAGRSISSGAAEIGAEIDGAAAGSVSPAAWPEAMCEGDEIRPERLLFDFASLSEEQRRGVLEILHRIGDLGLPVILRQALSRHLVLDLLEMLGMARDGS
ncbi:MAG: hypothetical protein JXA90_00625, partial [Planctomycetes bacterium]|nr:hypothetical protein [Planctomycetota bacterium]